MTKAIFKAMWDIIKTIPTMVIGLLFLIVSPLLIVFSVIIDAFAGFIRKHEKKNS